MKKEHQEATSFQGNWRLAKYFLALGLIIFVIAKTDLPQISSLGNRLSWLWLFYSFLTLCLMTVLKALQYQILIDRKVPILNTLSIVIWQNAISNFIASSAGIASYMTMLKAEQNVKLTRSGVVFIITKFGDLLAISLYLGLSSALVWDWIGPLRWLTILLILGMLLGLAAFLVTVWWRERFVDWASRVLAWLKLDRFAPIKRGLGMLRSLAREEQYPIFAMLRTGVLLSMAYMTVTMAFAYSSMRIFDVQIGLWPIIYVAALLQLVSFVPIQVLGGLGVSEVTSVYLYNFFGLDQAEMSAVMLGLRALFYLMNAVMLLYLPLESLSRHKKEIM